MLRAKARGRTDGARAAPCPGSSGPAPRLGAAGRTRRGARPGVSPRAREPPTARASPQHTRRPPHCTRERPPHRRAPRPRQRPATAPPGALPPPACPYGETGSRRAPLSPIRLSP